MDRGAVRSGARTCAAAGAQRRHLFAWFAHGDSDTGAGYEATFAEVLEDAVAVMRRRQDRLRGVTRLHTPSTAEPLVVLVVDELASLTGWVAVGPGGRR